MTVDYLVKKIENQNKKPVDLTEGSLALMNQEIQVKIDNISIEVSKEEVEIKVDEETVVKIPTSSCWESLLKHFRKKPN